MKKNYHFVIFDWDGTLMDSTARIVSSMQQTARIVDEQVPTVEAIKSTIGLSMEAVISQLFPIAGELLKTRIRDVYREQYVDKDQTPSPLFPGAMDLLRWLESNNVKAAVATGKARHGLSRALTSVGLENYFEYSVCADEATSKPHPEMVHRLLDLTGSDPDKTLVVGDSVHDINMAKNARVDSIGVTTGASSPQALGDLRPIAVLDCLTQLKEKVKLLS
ncbi:MAG: HAD-IA family hydrolase [Kangiellaceae bacterium]